LVPLDQPIFKEHKKSSCGGIPVLLELWHKLDLSLLLTRCGIFKTRGLPSWKLAFAMIVSMVSNCSSDSKRVEDWNKDTLLQTVLGVARISQSAMSRFLNGFSKWQEFTRLRITRLQEEPELRLEEGDVVALDDTLLVHLFARLMPFVAKVFDHALKTFVFAQNLLVLHGVKQNGLEYPLFYAFWKKADSKFDLALQALSKLRSLLPNEKMRLWVSMDRWFFKKPFLAELEKLNFDWVTKAKRNTVFYYLVPGPTPFARPRYVRIAAQDLIRKYYHHLLPASSSSGVMSFALNGLYLKVSEPVPGAKGRKKNRSAYKAVGAVLAMRLTEDEKEHRKDSVSSDTDPAASYKGAYLLVSNRADAPKEMVGAYQKRWRVEVLFRNAKQELGLGKCHSCNENHIEAHVALVFTAETLLRWAQWAYNEKMGPEERCTHGKMSSLFFRTQCTVDVQSPHHGKSDIVQVYFDTGVRKFKELFSLFWPKCIQLKWYVPQSNWNLLPLSG